jgi:hypothetical protein
MPFTRPFAGLDRRVAWLRATLLVACLLGMIISTPLWLNARVFPLLPVSRSLPILPAPLDKCFFATMLLALVLAAWRYRPAIIYFLAASLLAFFTDQNRGQPWCYLYWVLLLLTLLPEPTSLAACRLAFSVSYIWGGFQKLQPAFFNRVPDWFVAPATTRWHLPAEFVEILRGAVALAPFAELFIGIGLWWPKLRPAALVAVALLHCSALLFLGPLGYNYDQVIWPWNVAMIAIAFVLFSQSPLVEPGPAPDSNALSFSQNFAQLRRSKPATAILALFSFLPLLSFAGMWDSYFSFTLYAENQAKADIFVTQAFVNRLPPALRAHVHPLRQAFDPHLQGPFVFDFQSWGFKELRVPPILEPRNYQRIFHYLARYSREPEDLRMIVNPRSGPMTFYQGNIHLVVPNHP